MFSSLYIPLTIHRHNYKVLHILYTLLYHTVIDCLYEEGMKWNETCIDIVKHICITVTHDVLLYYLTLKTSSQQKL